MKRYHDGISSAASEPGAAGSVESADSAAARLKRARRPVSRYDGMTEGEDAMRVALERSKRMGSMEDTVVPDAPVYRPTADEWADPAAYIAKITPEGEKYGIVKIVPPPGWAPPSTESQRESSGVLYATRLQAVHRLQEGIPFPDGRSYSYSDYRRQANDLKYKKYAHLVDPSLRAPPQNDADVVDARLSTPPFETSDDSDSPRAGAAANAVHSAAEASSPPRAADAAAASKLRAREGSPYARMVPVVEREYWRIVERGFPELNVEYGNDQDTRTVGSGFSTLSRQHDGGSAAVHGAVSDVPDTLKPRWDDPEYYRRTGWNLNNLPFLSASVLRHVGEEVRVPTFTVSFHSTKQASSLVFMQINGVNVPWLYLGMLFSSFAWHNEDHYLYSMNYMHSGEGKTWYGIPGFYSNEFERAVTNIVYDRAKDDKDIFYQLTTVIPPAQLIAEKVPVYHLFQEAGEFVITFPQAYHSGFSHGFNMAEACNFALADWLPYGRRAVERYRSPASRRTTCFSHEQLLCNLAKYCNYHSLSECGTIVEELRQLIGAEERERAALVTEGVRSSVRLSNMDDPRYECVHCRHICFLSAVVCRCAAAMKQVACCRHSRSLCLCPASNKLLVYWYGLPDLQKLLADVTARYMSSHCQLASATAAPPTPHEP